MPWVIGSYFVGEDLADAFDRITWSLAIGLAMLAASLVGVFLVGRRLTRPILGLAEAAAAVGHSGPARAPVLPSSRQSAEDFARQCAATPLGRGSSPQEICDAVRYILGAPALTGQMIALDGGAHLTWNTDSAAPLE